MEKEKEKVFFERETFDDQVEEHFQIGNYT